MVSIRAHVLITRDELSKHAHGNTDGLLVKDTEHTNNKVAAIETVIHGKTFKAIYHT